MHVEEKAYCEFGDYFGSRFKAIFVRGGLSTSEAEDLAGSCITDIALKAGKYKPEENGSFKAFVFTLARHALADWWRIYRRSVPITDEPLEGISQEKREDLEPNAEVVLAVQEALARLSETDRRIIELRCLGPQHTYAEIGEILKTSSGAARVRLSRALRRLRFILEKDGRINTFVDWRDVANRGDSNGEQETE